MFDWSKTQWSDRSKLISMGGTPLDLVRPTYTEYFDKWVHHLVLHHQNSCKCYMVWKATHELFCDGLGIQTVPHVSVPDAYASTPTTTDIIIEPNITIKFHSRVLLTFHNWKGSKWNVFQPVKKRFGFATERITIGIPRSYALVLPIQPPRPQTSVNIVWKSVEYIWQLPIISFMEKSCSRVDETPLLAPLRNMILSMHPR